MLYDNNYYSKYIFVLLVNCKKGLKHKSVCYNDINSNYFDVGNIYCMIQNL